MGTTQADKRREFLVFEDRVRDLVGIIPKVPIRQLDTTGHFWLAVMNVRTSLKILEAMR